MMYMYCSIVAADTGNIGGTLSHEYHVTSSVGEDTLFVCQRYDGTVQATILSLLHLFSLVSYSCGCGYNKELLPAGDTVEHVRLPECREDTRNCQLEEVKGIEVSHPIHQTQPTRPSPLPQVAHAFYLGTKYSSMFRASFKDENNTEKWVCKHTGCDVVITHLV